jgi:2-(1,2-epoxy-1,2-dihydrophenyl)acetyl-CoA isomerase
VSDTGLLTDLSDGVLTLTLNRPDVLNAFTLELLSALRSAFEGAAGEPTVRCVVLTGAGRGFSAGADLRHGIIGGEGGVPSPDGLEQTVTGYYNPLIRAIRQLEKPVIAAVNGVAAGAGQSVALACDLRVASEKASFVGGFIRIGLIPDSGGTFIMPRLIGAAKAAELAFLGERVSADDALRLGLVNKVVPPDELLPAAHAWAAQLAALPTQAIGMTKRAYNAAILPDLDERLAHEAQLMRAAASTADHREGMQAFLEKREPRFTGQ